jgi:hypothetical protein
MEYISFYRGFYFYFNDNYNKALSDLLFSVDNKYNVDKCYLYMGMIYIHSGSKDLVVNIYIREYRMGMKWQKRCKLKLSIMKINFFCDSPFGPSLPLRRHHGFNQKDNLLSRVFIQ